ncbi:hypothetical protein ACFS7Z_08560 [Pontibacter toksunensis]|uniref:Uncharacterized protein n=1 Tax=Pontibacter toksunensis TaxID=1332631 RepID=A0ABW6BTT4_9BACT
MKEEAIVTGIDHITYSDIGKVMTNHDIVIQYNHTQSSIDRDGKSLEHGYVSITGDKLVLNDIEFGDEDSDDEEEYHYYSFKIEDDSEATIEVYDFFNKDEIHAWRDIMLSSREISYSL